MKNNLKLVGGTATTLYVIPVDTIEYNTKTEARSIEQFIGQERVLTGRTQNEYWRDYALYNQNVKSVVRISKIFSECLIKWKAETKITSSMTEIVLHPSYQRIIGIGPDVVPYILQELSENGGHWFWALQALTGENPIAEENQGRTKKMVEAWLDWGREHRLL